jgi:DNA-binding transcriptional ArsR family regulator
VIDFPAAKRVAAMLAALAEPTRLRILHQLSQGPQNVGTLAELLGVPMVNMSHHLGVMRQAGLLEDEREGRRVVYRLHPDVGGPGDGPDILATLDLGVYKVHVHKAAPPAKVTKPGKKKS